MRLRKKDGKCFLRGISKPVCLTPGWHGVGTETWSKGNGEKPVWKSRDNEHKRGEEDGKSEHNRDSVSDDMCWSDSASWCWSLHWYRSWPSLLGKRLTTFTYDITMLKKWVPVERKDWNWKNVKLALKTGSRFMGVVGWVAGCNTVGVEREEWCFSRYYCLYIFF